MDPLLPPGASSRTGPEPEPELESLEPGQTPSLQESVEFSLRALLQPAAVFERLVQAPPPPYPEMVLNFLFWTGLGLLIALFTSLNPILSAVQLGAIGLLAILIGGLVLAVPAAFAGAGVLHGLAKVSGGKGVYRRTFQIVSLLAPLSVLAALISNVPAPYVSVLTVLYGTFLSVVAVEKMHDAAGAQAWVVVGVAGLVLAAGQFTANRLFHRMHEAMVGWAMIRSMGPGAAAFRVQDGAAPPPVSPMSLGMPGGRSGRGAPMPAYSRTGSPGIPEGLGLGSGPAETMGAVRDIQGQTGALLGAITRGEAPSVEQIGKLQQAGVGLAKMTREKIQSDPGALKNMSPEQRRQVTDFLQYMEKFPMQASGKGDAATQREMMIRMKGLLQAVGSQQTDHRVQELMKKTQQQLDKSLEGPGEGR